jgi:hypothetical protein
MNKIEPTIEPILVDVPTACLLLSVKKTKLFGMLRPENSTLQRVKLGGKTLVTMKSIQVVANRGTK